MRVSIAPFNRAGVRGARRSESGFALILVAFLIVAAGAFMVYGLGVFQIKEASDQEAATREKMARLVDQLASFTQINGRVPCPADPAGDRTTAAFGREDRGGPGQACNRGDGIFPFLSLGLQEDDARDAWSRFYTYAPSPVFTRLDGVNDQNSRVHNLCRILETWVDDTQFREPGGTLSKTDRNLNPRKAKFCCPGNGAGYSNPNTDIRILVSRGGAAVPDPPVNRNMTDSGNMDVRISQASVPASSPEGIAFALVSHGENGAGAYIVDGTANRLAGVIANSDEDENQDGDNDFVSHPRFLVDGNAYFDDIIAFRTNFTLMSEVNVGTCLEPFR